MTEQPIMDWADEDPFRDRCVWWSRLDGRYQIEAHRHVDDDEAATLYIYDHDNDMQLLYEKDTGHLMFGAIFGPDVADVNQWQELAVNFVDGADGSN